MTPFPEVRGGIRFHNGHLKTGTKLYRGNEAPSPHREPERPGVLQVIVYIDYINLPSLSQDQKMRMRAIWEANILVLTNQERAGCSP